MPGGNGLSSPLGAATLPPGGGATKALLGAREEKIRCATFRPRHLTYLLHAPHPVHAASKRETEAPELALQAGSKIKAVLEQITSSQACSYPVRVSFVIEVVSIVSVGSLGLCGSLDLFLGTGVKPNPSPPGARSTDRRRKQRTHSRAALVPLDRARRWALGGMANEANKKLLVKNAGYLKNLMYQILACNVRLVPVQLAARAAGCPPALPSDL